jgi:hypothetical protein
MGRAYSDYEQSKRRRAEEQHANSIDISQPPD